MPRASRAARRALDWAARLARRIRTLGEADLARGSTATSGEQAGWRRAREIWLRGKTIVQEAAAGQWHDPAGLFYGGSRADPARAALWPALDEHVAAAHNILVIDLHTGLGPARVTQALPAAAGLARHREAYLQVLGEPLRHYESANARGDYYHPQGDLLSAVVRAYPGQRVIASAFETGTWGIGALAKMLSLYVMVLENQGHHRGYANARQRARIEDLYQRLFYPRSARWQAQIEHEVPQMILQTIDRFARLDPAPAARR